VELDQASDSDDLVSSFHYSRHEDLTITVRTKQGNRSFSLEGFVFSTDFKLSSAHVDEVGVQIQLWQVVSIIEECKRSIDSDEIKDRRIFQIVNDVFA
jgi:hypothetical protein